jgi:hypothetical protein
MAPAPANAVLDGRDVTNLLAPRPSLAIGVQTAITAQYPARLVRNISSAKHSAQSPNYDFE